MGIVDNHVTHISSLYTIVIDLWARPSPQFFTDGQY